MSYAISRGTTPTIQWRLDHDVTGWTDVVISIGDENKPVWECTDPRISSVDNGSVIECVMSQEETLALKPGPTHIQLRAADDTRAGVTDMVGIYVRGVINEDKLGEQALETNTLGNRPGHCFSVDPGIIEIHACLHIGVKGDDGYTPRKGIDYWTPQDVAEIDAAKIAATDAAGAAASAARAAISAEGAAATAANHAAAVAYGIKLAAESGEFDGADGASPTATVSKSGNVSIIAITDKNGTTTAQVIDGKDGVDGTVAFDDLTPEQRASLKGDPGAPGRDADIAAATAATNAANAAAADALAKAQQAQTLIDGSDAEHLNSKISEILSEIGGGQQTITPSSVAVGKKYILKNTTTKEVGLIDDPSFYACDLIDVSSCVIGSGITMKASLYVENGVFLISQDMVAIDYVNGFNAAERGYAVSTSPVDVTIMMQAGAKYIVSDIRSAFISDVSTFNVELTKASRIDELELDKDKYVLTETVVGKNKVDPSKTVYGYPTATGAIYETPNYVTSDYIKVKAGQTVTASPRIRFFIAVDKSKSPVFYYSTPTAGEYTYTATQDGYVRACFFKDDVSKQVEFGARKTPYREYYTKSVIAGNAHLSGRMVRDSGNALYGKKWCPCGDSFTYYTDAHLEDGTYKGQYSVYPYLIGNRTGMEIDDRFFLSGRTMAFPSDGSFHNSLTDPSAECYFMNIPDDADYITIMLGINDAQHIGSGTTSDGEVATGAISLGTIDDTSTATYYGAYNTVLAWIRENRPFAHVGIIVSNGIEIKEWVDAQINLAKKWGYPYINLNGDRFTPAMIRCYNPDMSYSLKEQVKRLQAVDYDGTKTGRVDFHPNAKAHGLMSMFIENWIRSI